MRKYQVLVYIFVPFISSCVIGANVTNNQTDTQTGIVDVSSSPSDIRQSNLTNTTNSESINAIQSSEPINPTITSDNTKVSVKPSENISSSTLVSKPGGNIDPNKFVSVISDMGSTDINFNEGTNEIALKINFTEFKTLSLVTEDIETESLEVSLTINSTYNKIIKIEKKYFENQKYFTMKIKGLKNIDSLDISITAKDKNNSVISKKQIMNEEVKGNKTKEVNFSKTNPQTSKKILPEVISSTTSSSVSKDNPETEDNKKKPK